MEVDAAIGDAEHSWIGPDRSAMVLPTMWTSSQPRLPEYSVAL